MNVCLMVIWRAAAGQHRERKKIKCLFCPQSPFLLFCNTSFVMSPLSGHNFFLCLCFVFLSLVSQNVLVLVCLFSLTFFCHCYLSLYLFLLFPLQTFHLMSSPLQSVSLIFLLSCHLIDFFPSSPLCPFHLLSYPTDTFS